MNITQSWDTAIKAGKSNDFSVCATFSQAADGTHRLLEVWRGRVEYPQLKRKLVELATQWQPHAILIEDKASGQSLIQDMRRETSLPIIPVMPRGDKVLRFSQVTPMIESGRVSLPYDAPWLAEFEYELMSFPDGAHDDQVDALSQYLNWVRMRQMGQLNLRRL